MTDQPTIEYTSAERLLIEREQLRAINAEQAKLINIQQERIQSMVDNPLGGWAEAERLRALLIEHHSISVSRGPAGGLCPVCQPA